MVTWKSVLLPSISNDRLMVWAMLARDGRDLVSSRLCEDRFDHMPVHIGESAVDAVMAKGEARVVKAELMQDRSVDIVDRGRGVSIKGFVTPDVALTVRQSALDASAAEPVGENERVMIAALAALRRRHAAKLGGPQDERVLEHSALLEILDEGRGAARHAKGERAVVALEVLMGIPVAAREAVVIATPHLHKAHAALQQPPRRQALLGEIKCLFVSADFLEPILRAAVEAVGLEDVLRLGLEVERLRCGQLHTGSKFIATDARVEPLIAFAGTGVLMI